MASGGAKQIAIDLGTANTRLFHRGLGLVLDEPTLALFEKRSHNMVAIGAAAAKRADDPGFELVRPFKNGTAADAEVVEQYVAKLLNPYGSGLFARQHVIVAVPSASSPLERRLIRESVQASGPDHVHVIENVLAAALGAGVAIHEPVGAMVVDAGAGITEAALLSLGAVVAASSVRFGGLDVDRALQSKLRREYAMDISDRRAEKIKIAASEFVSARGSNSNAPLIEARGYSTVDAAPITAILEEADLAPILREHWNSIIEAIRTTLTQAPTELGQDLFSSGIQLVGGAAQAPALASAIDDAFGIPVRLVPTPEHAVIVGAAKCLEAPDVFADLFLGEKGLA